VEHPPPSERVESRNPVRTILHPPVFKLRQHLLHLVGISWFSNPTAGTRRFFRAPDFPVCRIAGFPTRRPFASLARPTRGQSRRLGNLRSARLQGSYSLFFSAISAFLAVKSFRPRLTHPPGAAAREKCSRARPRFPIPPARPSAPPPILQSPAPDPRPPRRANALHPPGKIG